MKAISELLREIGVTNYQFMIPATPTPASRPRFVKKTGQLYYGKKYRAWMRTAAPLVANWEPDVFFNGPVGVVVMNRVKRPKTTKREHPVGDCDNYVKGPLDLITKAGHIWHDDDQVVFLATAKEFVETTEEEGTFVLIHPMDDEELEFSPE